MVQEFELRNVFINSGKRQLATIHKNCMIQGTTMDLPCCRCVAIAPAMFATKSKMTKNPVLGIIKSKRLTHSITPNNLKASESNPNSDAFLRPLHLQ